MQGGTCLSYCRGNSWVALDGSEVSTELRVVEWVGPLLLSPREVARVPPRVRGIYMLHAFAPEYGAYPVLYVGKSTRLRERLTDHLDDLRAKQLIRSARHAFPMSFSAAPIADQRLLDRVESGLIRALRPVANQQVPTAPPVLVNLPPLVL